MTASPHQQEAVDRTATIRSLNDAFRGNPVAGRVMLTSGVDALPRDQKLALLTAVVGFDRFDAGNDPFHEHDFGAAELGGECFFWKIDYYDADLQHGSPDPADEAVTCRVMTIMRAYEY